MTQRPSLFDPITIQELTLKNRIVVSPMCQYSSVDGYASDWHLVHLGQFAVGQASAVIQEATAVSPGGRISYADLGLWEDGHIKKLTQICSFIKSQGSIPGIQLAHAGRKASTEVPWLGKYQYGPNENQGWKTTAPSPIPYYEGDHLPAALIESEIHLIKNSFREAAQRAVTAGYQIIEIHAAHGYLIHQFLSPLTNQRQDHYGVTFENRIRLLMEIIEAINDVITSEHSLWVRISATDWAPGGWDLAQSIKLTEILKTNGVQLVDVSSGGAVHHQEITIKPGYQVPFSAKIREATGIKTGTVGLITTAAQAQTIIASESADLVLIGREFLRDPHLPLRWARDLEMAIDYAPQYGRAKFN